MKVLVLDSCLSSDNFQSRQYWKVYVDDEAHPLPVQLVLGVGILKTPIVDLPIINSDFEYKNKKNYFTLEVF